jgi:hypothetical protein
VKSICEVVGGKKMRKKREGKSVVENKARVKKII